MTFDNRRSLHIVQEKHKLTIEFSWFHLWHILAYILVMVGFFYLCLINPIHWDGRNIILIFVTLIQLLFIGAVPVLFYRILTYLFNETIIEVDKKMLTIKHGPIPWWKGNITLPTNEIIQLFVKETIRSGEGGDTYLYSLRAIKRDNFRVTLLSKGILQDKETLKIEALIEQFLGIENAPVKGEYKEP